MRKKRLWKLCFIVYCFMLSWGILLKFSLPPYYIGARVLNVIPYQDVARTWDGRLDLQEVFFNIASFIPLGVGFYRLWKKSFWQAVILCVSVSLFYEGMQYLLAIGMADVTDVIHNSLGGMFGVLMARFLFGGRNATDSKS